MLRLIIVISMIVCCFNTSKAEDAQAPSLLDRLQSIDLKQHFERVKGSSFSYVTWIYDSIMPDWKKELALQADAFNASLPILDKLGYEVSTIGVNVTFPKPTVKVRLRSKAGNNPPSDDSDEQEGQTVFVKGLISSAKLARKIQSTMNLGTAVLDVDLLSLKVRMSFLRQKRDTTETQERKPLSDISLNELDLICAQD